MADDTTTVHPNEQDMGSWAFCRDCRGVTRGKCMCVMHQDFIDHSACKAHRLGRVYPTKCRCTDRRDDATGAGEVSSRLRYAVATVLDQTWGYDAGGCWTCKHAEALLHTKLDEAVKVVVRLAAEDALGLRKNDLFKDCSDDDLIKRIAIWIETIDDEDEFRAREDTW